ncbi:18S rRNA biogenesis protein [Pelomyxa schiedti]|nr:18S rRNA biogenesis protein [Pelomyxa schiedti]
MASGALGRTTKHFFNGCREFRMRVACAALSQKAVRIENIRTGEASPGVADFEVCFLQLMSKVSNGARFEITVTGTSILFVPGILTGGKIEHDCGLSRGIGYFAEYLILLAPFMKEPLEARLTGMTNTNEDPSVDMIRHVSIPNLMKFGIPEGFELKILGRGAPPEGVGEVVISCPIVKTLTAINFVNMGSIRRVRGVVYSSRVSPLMANRVVASSRAILNEYVSDVYITSDHRKGPQAGMSPGYAVLLVAETTTEGAISAELAAGPGDVPEDVGKKVSAMLLLEIQRRGSVDLLHQLPMLLMMTCCPEDVSRIRLGPLSQQTIDGLRLIKDMFGTTFKFVPDHATHTVVLSCLGNATQNIARRIY